MNSKNSKTSDSHRLLLNLSDKISLKRNQKYVAFQTLAFTIHVKIQKSHPEIINLKHQLRYGIKSFNCLMDHILYQIFKVTVNIP